MNTGSNSNKTVRVGFPCIHSNTEGELLTISCFPTIEMKGIVKVVSGIDDESARRIIGTARYGERDEKAGIGVIVMFSNPLFMGNSYGLALAVADKLARFDAAGKWHEIYATGCIPVDGCGSVSAIEGFAEKLEALVKKSVPGSLLIYPKSNHENKHVSDLLSRLTNAGIECCGINHLNDLEGYVWAPSSGKNIRSLFSLLKSDHFRVLKLHNKSLLIALFALILTLIFTLSLQLSNPSGSEKQNKSGSILKSSVNQTHLSNQDNLQDKSESNFNNGDKFPVKKPVPKVENLDKNKALESGKINSDVY